MDIETILNMLISSAATHKAKIESLERDLTRAFREIETLRQLSALALHEGKTS